MCDYGSKKFVCQHELLVRSVTNKYNTINIIDKVIKKPIDLLGIIESHKTMSKCRGVRETLYANFLEP
jgi:hypothetical protein